MQSAVPTPAFTISPSLSSWNLPSATWLTTNNKTHVYNGLATATLVFNSSNQILLLQRAAHDSMPNKWELPGGASDPTDATILHAAARELREETGLVATQFLHIVDPHERESEPFGQVFTNSTKTKTFCRFSFLAEVENCDTVVLDPAEHQNYVWVTEAEAKVQKLGESDIPITTQSVIATILEGFRIRKTKAVGL